MTTADGDAGRPDELLDGDAAADDGDDDGPDLIIEEDDEDDEEDDESEAALDRAYRRQLAEDLDAIGEWLDDWAGFHANSIDEAMDTYAETLPDVRREHVEEAMTFMDGAVAQLRDRVLALREWMDEQEGWA